MKSDIYIWDTKEQQEQPNPYGFVDFPDDFLNVFLEKRTQTQSFFQTNLPLQQISYERGYSEEELKSLDKFETAKTILNLYSTMINGKDFSEIQLKHFWRILKKVEVRKLRRGYDSNFINTNKEDLDLESKAILSFTLMKYSQTKQKGYLQVLSTALKLNDTLISEKENLNPLESSLLLESLKLEKQQVEELAKEKGVLK